MNLTIPKVIQIIQLSLDCSLKKQVDDIIAAAIFNVARSIVHHSKRRSLLESPSALPHAIASLKALV